MCLLRKNCEILGRFRESLLSFNLYRDGNLNLLVQLPSQIIMAIITTPAIVLRRIDHSETSLICTLYTREYGKISVIAKGARRPKSPFAGILDLMNYLQIVVYTKESRNIQTLSEAEYIRPFNRLQQSMNRAALGMVILETIQQAIIGEEPHPEVFDLIVETLTLLNDDSERGIELLWWFHIHFASLAGFQPQFKTCYNCGRKLTTGYLSADTGQMHCERCITHQPGMTSLADIELRMLDYLQRTPILQIESETIRQLTNQNAPKNKHIRPQLVTDTLVKYLRYHLEGIGTLRTLDFFTTFE